MEYASKVSKLSLENTKVGAIIGDKYGVNHRDSEGRLIHAEDAVLREAVDVRDATLFVTIAPCMECALKIIEHGGVTKVICGPPHPSPVYRCTEALEMLKKRGIEVKVYSF